LCHQRAPHIQTSALYDLGTGEFVAVFYLARMILLAKMFNTLPAGAHASSVKIA